MRVALPEAGSEARPHSGAGDHQTGEHGIGAALVGARRLLGHRFVGQYGDELAQAPYAEHGHTRHQRRLPRRLLRHDHLAIAGLGRREDGWENASDRTDPAVEAQFPDQHQIGDGARLDTLGCSQYGYGDC